jgi:DNA primase
MQEKAWVDFKQVKETVSMAMVLEQYGVNWLRKSRDQLRGRCPIHKGEGERTFHVSLTKEAFNCFSCGAKGNVLDFVAAMEGCTIREAALKLQEWFGVGEGRAAARKAPKTKADRPAGQATVVNPPLGFELRVDPEYEYGPKRGLSPETVRRFGAGLCLSKGMFSGRYVMPLHDGEGQLVGYAGRSIDGREPKYLFPAGEKGFQKRHLLFNLHREIEKPAEERWAVVVEGFFDAMKVAQAGYPCVALLGSTLSAEQEELLYRHFRRVVVLFDGDEAGRSAAEDCLVRLGRRLFVRAVMLGDGEQPDSMTVEEIRATLETAT